jgi:hypothetical protein
MDDETGARKLYEAYTYGHQIPDYGAGATFCRTWLGLMEWEKRKWLIMWRYLKEKGA